MFVMPVVVALKVATVVPAAIGTVDGTVKAELLLASVITAPPAGAGWFTLTVQALDEFGPRLVGLQESEETSTELASVKVVFTELPL